MLLCKEKFLWIIWHGVDKNLQGQIISLMFSRQLSCSVYVKCFSVLSRIGTDSPQLTTVIVHAYAYGIYNM